MARDHVYECWVPRPGGVCRTGCSCWCHGQEERAAFGRHAYLSIADELDGDAAFMGKVDPHYKAAAKDWARNRGLAWPPPTYDVAKANVEGIESTGED